jgi:hypothetical protein
LTDEELEIITYNLLNLDFFANFSKFTNVFNDISKEDIFQQLSKFLGIDRMADFKMEFLSNLGSDNMASNILKYLLSINFFDLSVGDHTGFKEYPFTELISFVIDNSEDKFEEAFGTYIKELWVKFGDRTDFEKVVKEDVNLLIQIAYQFSFKPAFQVIMNNKKIIMTNFFIEGEDGLQLITLIGMGGFHDLMEIYIRLYHNEDIIFDFFRNCLKGHLEANFSKECRKYKSIGISDYETFLDILIEASAFKNVMEEYNPMAEAFKQQNEYAMLKLIKQFGLRHNFFNDVDRDTIESFLNSCVQKRKNEYEESYVEIDYDFLRNGSFLFDNTLLALTESPESTELITHPVIKLYVELVVKQFKYFHYLNFLLFVVFYITPALYGFVGFNYIGYLFAFAYIFIRELCQLIFTTIYNRESRWKFYAVNYDVEADMTSRNNTRRSFNNGFYDSKMNILETVLTITTLGTSLSLLFEMFLLYKICLVATILLGTIEVSILLMPVVSKQGIYWVRNKISFKVNTFSS